MRQVIFTSCFAAPSLVGQPQAAYFWLRGGQPSRRPSHGLRPQRPSVAHAAPKRTAAACRTQRSGRAAPGPALARAPCSRIPAPACGIHRTMQDQHPPSSVSALHTHASPPFPGRPHISVATPTPCPGSNTAALSPLRFWYSAVTVVRPFLSSSYSPREAPQPSGAPTVPHHHMAGRPQ